MASPLASLVALPLVAVSGTLPLDAAHWEDRNLLGTAVRIRFWKNANIYTDAIYELGKTFEIAPGEKLELVRAALRAWRGGEGHAG